MAELFLGGQVDPATHERTGDDVRIDADDLTTHAVIVGMTGSGKTGLGIVLVEEVLTAGRPALVIDPKGDLTNLCLTFPALQPADFRPWIDARQATTQGLSADAFAAEQAEAWSKGLAAWHLSGANIAALQSAADFTIYTPGSRSGVPINVVGSLQVPVDTGDAEVVGDEIDGYVSGLLGLVGVGADPLTSREHILLSNLIAHTWGEGRPLDLPALVGMVGNPPIRKLGVFELDQFFPADARMELALKLNGLLASPSFAAWADGPALDIGSMLYTDDGKPRCAIVTTAHLSDEERQFVTALVLSKLVTWMRRQSGTTELRALLYMDEVAGYLPPTANPATKKPVMTLMKQARAFGLGVVLATQNPVDVDYKALSNAGTWMIGRLQTERDKQRLTEGMSSASGGIDVNAVAATISGLAKREFVLRRAGRDSTEVFTTRWAMSYLRGPMTRDQIASLTAGRRTTASSDTAAVVPPPGASDLGSDETSVMPKVAEGIAVRWIDVAAPWLAAAGGDASGTQLEPVVVCRVRLRYDDTKAALTHDQEYECVLSELTDPADPSRATPVDYDDRDLRTEPQSAAVYRITAAPLDSKSYFGVIERGLRDHLARSVTIELPANPDLKLYARPGESPTDFAARCDAVADDRAAAEIAKLRDKYEAKATRARDAIAGAEDRVDVLHAEAEGRRNDELLSTAGSILGDLLGGRSRSRTLRSLGSAAGRRGRTAAARERVDAAEGKVGRLHQDLADLEAELAGEIAEIDARWQARADSTSTISIGLERTDVQVAGVVLAWMPVT
jgi:DNA helicase HerA-like ATPase